MSSSDSDFKQPRRWKIRCNCGSCFEYDKDFVFFAILGSILFFYYLLVGLISFFSGKNAYDKVRKEFPEYDFAELSKGIMIVHWCYFGFSFVFSISLILLPFTRKMLWFTGVVLFGGFVSYIAYLVIYFISAEFKFSPNFVTYKKFLINQQNMSSLQVDAIISFEGPEFNIKNFGVSISTCYLLPYENRFKGIKTDDLNISFPPPPPKGQIFRVKTNYDVTITETSKANLTKFIVEGLDCIQREQSRYGSLTTVMKLEGSLYYGFSGILDNYFVVNSLNDVGFLSRSSKIASGLFAAGVYTAYKVRSFPTYEQTVVRKNVDFQTRSYPFCNIQAMRYRCSLQAPIHNDGPHIY